MSGNMAGYGFPRSMRILKTDEYSSVFSLRLSAGNEWFQVLGKRNDGPCGRLGLVVGKKTAKQAVARNYMKRTIRETFRQHASDLAGLDLVVRVRKRFGRREAAQVRASLLQLLQRMPRKCRA